jgi:hypothetical protein
MECVLETKARTIVEFIRGVRGSLAVTLEEGISRKCRSRCRRLLSTTFAAAAYNLARIRNLIRSAPQRQCA